jgi:chloride channel protein, CIC family
MSSPSLPPVPSHPLRWFPEFLALSQRRFRSQGRLLMASVLVGVVAGLGAVLFASACHLVIHYSLDSVAGYRPEPPAGEAILPWLHDSARSFRPWLLPVVAGLGGLLSGLIVFTFAPEAEGHGTDSVIAAYHFHAGQIRPRVPLVKLLASAITIGTGGSGGREGPIAQIGAGFGSLLANLLRLRPAERRILLAAGMGAGIAAIFRAPLAGALFAAEVLYRSPEFESEVILPAALACVVAYCTFGLFFGWHALFQTPALAFSDPAQLVPYLVLGVLMALLAMLYTRTFYWVSHLFRRLRLPAALKPAVGALASAGLGLALFYLLSERTQTLAVLSTGYGILQEGLYPGASLPAGLLLAVAVGKILATSLTIGSGGSGGVFGPSMVIGGCGGAALGQLVHDAWPALAPHPQSFLILGMAGFFAAAAKTPFSTIVIVSEMTGDYKLLLPALWVCTLAYLLSDEQSLYHSQVSSRSRSPAHQGDYVREVLAGLTVGRFLKPDSEFPALHPDDTLPAAIERFGESPYPVLPVVDADRKLLGVLNLEEVHLASRSPHLGPWVLAADLMRARVAPLRPSQRLDEALELFVENDLLALPVVDDYQRVLGIVRRFDIAQTYLRHVHGPPARPEPPGPEALPREHDG